MVHRHREVWFEQQLYLGSQELFEIDSYVEDRDDCRSEDVAQVAGGHIAWGGRKEHDQQGLHSTRDQ